MLIKFIFTFFHLGVDNTPKIEYNIGEQLGNNERDKMIKKERIRARCDDEFYKRLLKGAKKSKRNVSDFVRHVVDNYLKRHKI